MRLRPKSKAFTVLCLLAASELIWAQDLGQPDDPQAIQTFEASIKASQYSQVKEPLVNYTVEHPQSWRALYQLGYVYFRLHDFRESVSVLSKSLIINDQFAEAHKILGFDLNILGRKDLAIRELLKAISLEPKSFECHYELGRIYYDAGFYVKAVEQLVQARDLEPSVVKVYHNLGLAYSAVGDNSKAVQSFEESLRLNAKQVKPSAWPLIDYAAYFNSQNNFRKAKDLLISATHIDDSWDQEFDELSKAYRGLGEVESAIDSLKRAIAINPRKAQYHYALARLYSQTHQPAQAKEELAEYEKDRQKSVNPN
jgi:tetratricopeptide (TPR) repeat protein